MRYWGPLAVLLVLLLAAEQGGAAEVRTVLGLAHDSNLYEAEASPQSGWVSRLYVVSSGTLLRHRSGSLRIEYRGGIKRFWQAERSSTEGAGEVVANQALVSGAFRVHQRVVLSGSGELKLKNVNRVPGEEAYLRGAFESRLNASVGRGFEGGAHYRLGADDSRDVLLPEVILKELGMEAQYRRSRAFRARLHAAWRWLDYDRDALTVGPGGVILPAGVNQSDLLREFSAGIQAYRGMLVDLKYAYLDNRSNSYGYGFTAHRLQATVIRHLVAGLDGQVFVNVQFRAYGEPLSPLPGAVSEADEYEQTLMTLKLSKQLDERFGVSAQYGFFRNGARRSGAFYRKHVYTLSLEASL